jgi:hypothetical protein
MRVITCMKVRIPMQNLNIYVPKVRRNNPFNKILQITIIEATKQQIPEAVLWHPSRQYLRRKSRDKKR